MARSLALETKTTIAERGIVVLDAIKEHGGMVTVITQTLMVCIWLVILHMVKVLTGGSGKVKIIL